MTLRSHQAKRVRDLLASALAQEQNAFEMLRKYMTTQGLHVDDLGIGNDAGVGPGGGAGGGEQDDVGGAGSQEESFILAWLSHEKVRCAYDSTLSWRHDAVDPNDPLSRVGRQPLTLRRIIRGLTKDAARVGVRLPRRLIDAVLAGWQEDQRRDYARKVFSRINHLNSKVSAVEEADGREALARLCRLRLDDDPDYAAAVILTIIHQIKRKLLGLPVNDHLALTIYGSAGGTGKSEFIRALLRPLGKLSADTSLGELLDDRNVALWSQYALNLDDLDESAARQRGQFRRRITQPEWMARVLGTGETRSVINNATILGTTHHRIFEIMPDRFSMRRFAELHSRETRPEDEAIAAVDLADWPAIWRSVDPEGPRPIDKLGFGAMLRDRQAAARVRGPVEQWLDDLTPTDPSLAAHTNPNGWIKASDLYERCYKPYAERNLGAEGRLSKDGFGKDLRALLRARGVRAPLKVRAGRITTEYRLVASPPEAPTAPTPTTTTRLLAQPGATRH